MGINSHLFGGVAVYACAICDCDGLEADYVFELGSCALYG